MTFSRAAARAGERGGPAALPAPPGLPAGLTSSPRVVGFISRDRVVLGCGSDQHARQCLEVAQGSARALDPRARIRCAASAETAARHLDPLTASGNNHWAVCRTPGGADQVILQEMGDLAVARLMAGHTRLPAEGGSMPRMSPALPYGLPLVIWSPQAKVDLELVAEDSRDSQLQAVNDEGLVVDMSSCRGAP